MKTIHSQRGVTAIGWMIIIAIIIFFAYIAMKLIPIYIESFSVDTAVNSLVSEPGLGKQSPTQIRKVLLKRLDINMADSVAAEDVYITREQNAFLVEVEYEVREPFLANIDLLLSFKKSARISKVP